MSQSRRARFLPPLFSLGLCGLLMEGALRVLLLSGAQNQVLLTNSTFVLDQRGVPRLTPNQQVRWILMAGGRPEFDVRHATNNLGFIDHQDYVSRPDGRGLAFVGDSFTAGVEGGGPWIPALRDATRAKVPGIEMFNLGTGGAGVAQFSQLLDSAAHDVAFDAIAILAITDDFYRPPWVTMREGNELRLCRQGEAPVACLGHQPVAYIIDGDETTEELATHISGPGLSQRPRTLKDWLRQSRVLLLLKYSWDRYGPPGRALYAQNVDALSAIKKRFPTEAIHFVHLPQKEEVRAGHYFKDLREDVERAGIQYHAALTECAWAEDLFYASDTHPNARGYQVLSDCVSQLVVNDYLNSSATAR